jgi:hypothetical protein
MYVSDVEGLYNYAEFFDFVNCFVSVYSFDDKPPEMGVMWPREKVVIDALFMDFDSKENPAVTLKDVKKFINFLLSRSTTPIVYFSGSKGFHVYVPFEPVRLFSPKDTLKRVAVTLVELLELKTADLNVAEIARVARLPLSINSKSGLPCTPISPERLLRMNYDDIVKFVKTGDYDLPELDNSAYFREFFEYVDARLLLQKGERGKRARGNVRPAKGKWKERIKHYTEVVKKHGRLSADEKVRKIHSKSEFVSRMDSKSVDGAIEHIARVHFVLMLLEEGYSDEEIHQIFSYFEDYDPKRTQYYIDYNRGRLQKDS